MPALGGLGVTARFEKRGPRGVLDAVICFSKIEPYFKELCDP